MADECGGMLEHADLRYDVCADVAKWRIKTSIEWKIRILRNRTDFHQ